MCHSLGSEYGIPARFILNYDFTFLAVLLWEPDELPRYSKKRCMVGPCRGKCVCQQNDAISRSAGYSIILTWWKLKDTVKDENFFKGVPSHFAMMFLKRAYNNAVKKYPEFDSEVELRIRELSELEKDGEKSIDKTSDQFAQILASASNGVEDKSRQRILEQLLYHVGRWIYLIDAYQDISEDMKAGRYNPLVSHYGTVDGDLSAESKDAFITTLRHSQNLAASAFTLLPEGSWSDIIRNIIYLGMPDVSDKVLSKRWKKTKDKMP